MWAWAARNVHEAWPRRPGGGVDAQRRWGSSGRSTARCCSRDRSVRRGCAGSPRPGCRVLSPLPARGHLGGTGGRPGRGRGYCQRRLTMPACQRGRVRGEAIRRSWLRCLLGGSRVSADRIARSAHDSLGVLTWRCTAATWWRRSKISVPAKPQIRLCDTVTGTRRQFRHMPKRAQGATSPGRKPSGYVVSQAEAGPKYLRPKILVIDAPEVAPVLQQRGYAAVPGSFGQPIVVQAGPVTCR